MENLHDLSVWKYAKEYKLQIIFKCIILY
jgi:hypothetical protein